MKNKFLLLGLLLILASGFIFLKIGIKDSPSKVTGQKPVASPVLSDAPQFSVVAENLDTPWALAFLPDPPSGEASKSMLVTERAGQVKLINVDGKVEEVATLSKVKEIGEGGLLGIALHPQFLNNNFVYLYYTFEGLGDNTLNRVVRMIYKDGELKDEKIIVDNIPGAPNHNGGRIKFGPDKFLYITTGDAQNPSLSQDKNSLAGKILRVTDEGKEVPGNPYGNLAYSYGHRNPQGLAWGKDGRLWETEHGQSAQDEVNVIYPGTNYHWPELRGDEQKQGDGVPFIHSGSNTWAPSGTAIWDYTLFFGGLRGAALFAVDIKPDPRLVVKKRPEAKEYFRNEFGRIREVISGPDNMIYITTSNQDGRGIPKIGDDKIIRVNPQKL